MKRFAIFITGCLLFGCTKVPVSGRRQLNLLPESDLIEMSSSQYTQILDQSIVIENTPESELVEKVGRNISEAVEGYLERNHQQKRFKGFDWEFKLIQDDAANAWCMPGGKICFYTGILEYTKDENGLAVVMGHEIAHAIARHGNERMSKAIAAQMGGVALSVALMNQSTQTQELFKEAYGISSGLSGLAFSRRNELESDKLGLVFMHLAGYDATKAPDFWVRMTQNKQQIPAFLSTHPSGDKRIEEIRSFLASEKFQKYTSK
ncbi:MAG: peptidase M48 [Flavobacteriales bacterium]|nr:peptidase M48 [Flavobacteriales bacterium]|tara:strand:+ start:3354 stop:4142 length:789 start_codon:yes stop_codon:yes gene_type:complete